MGENHYRALNQWVAAHSVGQHLVPVGPFKSPEVMYRARTAEPGKVAELRKSFASTFSIHKASVVVLFWPEDMELPSEENFDIHHVISEFGSSLDGFFFIVGDHTQQAVTALHGQYPKNPLWHGVHAEVLVCKRSRQAYAMLKSWGVVDNFKGEKRAYVTFTQKIMSLRDDWTNYLSDTQDMEPSDKSAVLLAIKSTRRLNYGMTVGSFGQWWGLASKSDKVWTLLEKIFTGRVATPGKKKAPIPRSASNFTQMGGIPEEDLCVLLEQVVGGLPLKQFTKACRFYKAKARVQTEILDHEEIHMDDWLQGQERFPHACSDALVEMWGHTIISSNIGARTPLPSGFFQMLQKAVNLDLQAQKTRRQIAMVSDVFSY